MRNAYHRVVVRTWYVALPIAVARGDIHLATRARDWHDARLGLFPDSPFARMMHAAIRAYLVEGGLEDSEPPDPERLLPSFELDHSMPSWVAAAEAVVGRWLATGDVETARRAVEAIAASNASFAQTSSLARGLESILRARLALAGDEGDAAQQARVARGCFGASSAPWWEAKAIRALEAAGAAGPDAVGEAERIERGLGITRS